MGNAISQILSEAGGSLAGGVVNAGLGMAIGAINRNQQEVQQRNFMNQQLLANEALTDYNQKAAFKMWEDTNYPAQVEQLKKAGLNSALLYGKGGGGGATANVTPGNVQAGQAAPDSGNVAGMTMQGEMMGMQIQLLRAQKENIEADTKNKEAQAGYTSGAQTANTEASTEYTKGPQTDVTKKQIELNESQKEKIDLENAFTAWAQGTDENGQPITNNSPAAQQYKANVDKTKTDKLVNDSQVQQMAANIKLMAKQGNNIEQITKNLEKDGTLKEFEIKWQNAGLTKGDIGTFINTLIHHLIK